MVCAHGPTSQGDLGSPSLYASLSRYAVRGCVSIFLEVHMLLEEQVAQIDMFVWT
jgi:hypothetical protein